MAISADVLATALQELMPSYSELFTTWHPLLEKVVQKGNIDRQVLTGPYREFTVVTGGPGEVTQILTGSEVIAGGRNQTAVRGDTYAPRLIYAFDVPGKDLAEANGQMDLAKILKNYPELALADFHERLSDQVGTGNGSNVGGFLTLNGATTYNPNGTARTGAFEFTDTATQVANNASIFGLAKGSTAGWVNQHEDISSFAFNGRKQMRKAYFKANRQGSKITGGIDLMLGSEGSYLNYIEDLDDQVQVAAIKNDTTPGQIRQGMKFLDASFFLEDSIDVSATELSGDPNAAGGVIYMLKTATWFAYTLGHDASKETKGDFAVRGPFRIPEQDLFRYEIVLNMGLHTNQLRCQAAVTGGDVA
jgi:hypothetical protein